MRGYRKAELTAVERCYYWYKEYPLGSTRDCRHAMMYSTGPTGKGRQVYDHIHNDKKIAYTTPGGKLLLDIVEKIKDRDKLLGAQPSLPGFEVEPDLEPEAPGLTRLLAKAREPETVGEILTSERQKVEEYVITREYVEDWLNKTRAEYIAMVKKLGGSVEDSATTLTPEITPAKPQTVGEILTSERQKDYGDPAETFADMIVADPVLAKCPDPAVRHALRMIWVKMVRLTQSPYHVDSVDDIDGYAETIRMIRKARGK